MSSTSPAPTTVWSLAESTGQPIGVVIFQAVAYDAFNPDGSISAEWSGSLTSILHASRPWRRPLPSEPPMTPVGMPDPGSTVAPQVDSVQGFAAQVLENLGQRMVVADRTLARRLVELALGQLDGDAFVAYAEEAPTWADLADGKITIVDLEAGGSSATVT